MAVLSLFFSRRANGQQIAVARGEAGLPAELPSAFCCMIQCRYLVLAIVPFLLSACFTTRNSKAIAEDKSPINEFDRALRQGSIHRVLTGQMFVRDRETILQFAGVLAGEGRLLNVVSDEHGLRFYETQGDPEKGTRVFLLQQNACCMDDAAFRTILFLKSGQLSGSDEILQRHFGYATGELQYPTALLVMDFSNVYTFSAMHAVWKTGSEVSYFSQVPGADYNVVMSDIDWRRRSKAGIAARYAMYAVTVPADIITGPFQLAALLLYGRGMVK